MSSIVSAIGTVFSSVATTVSNVGSAIMGVGSSLFTAGAAGASGSVLSGTLGNIVKGALTQGAIGALVGGGISALTGGSFGQGALMGGLGGALSGGFMGAAGMQTNPFADGFGTKLQDGIGADPTAATKMAVTGKTGGVKNTIASSGARAANLMEPGMPEAFRAPSVSQAAKAIQPGAVMNAGAQGVTTPLASGVSKNVMGGGQSGGGLLSGLLSGETVAGIGKGLFEGYAAQQRAKEQQALIAAQLQREQMGIDEREREQRRRAASYRIGPEGYNQPAQDSGAGRPEPSTKYARYFPRKRYDPVSGFIVDVA